MGDGRGTQEFSECSEHRDEWRTIEYIDSHRINSDYSRFDKLTYGHLTIWEDDTRWNCNTEKWHSVKWRFEEIMVAKMTVLNNKVSDLWRFEKKLSLEHLTIRVKFMLAPKVYSHKTIRPVEVSAKSYASLDFRCCLSRKYLKPLAKSAIRVERTKLSPRCYSPTRLVALPRKTGETGRGRN